MLNVDMDEIKYSGWYIAFLANQLDEFERIDNKMTIEDFVNYVSNPNSDHYCPIAESLEESLKQMFDIREGKLPKKTWKEFKKEI